MANRDFDVLIVGAGFAGSILGMVLHQAGFRVALVDRAKHPRFAIGESSTPAAAMVLLALADHYDLPCLEPLAKYGPLQEQLPRLDCGLKRGFAYFDHTQSGPWSTDRQLLVAANPDAVRGDVQWRRAAVDQYLFHQARARLPLAMDGVATDVRPVASGGRPDSRGGWTATVRSLAGDSPLQFDVPFIVDATGGADVIGQAEREPPQTLQTNTSVTYGHIRGLRSWDDLLPDAARTRHPFASDDSAQHHLLKDGWVWVLRFADGAASVGRVYRALRCGEELPSTFEQFRHALSPYSALAEMLAEAQPVDDSWRTAAPVQRLAKKMTGADWALLPGAAGIIDPLHSTGIAHSLCGIESLAKALTSRDRASALRQYEHKLKRELRWIDTLVAAAYRRMPDFRSFGAASMLYFAAATTFERRRLAGDEPWFLCADDAALQSAVEAWIAAPPMPHDALEAKLRELLAPWNHVGLCDPDAGNMYRYDPEEF